MNLRAILYFLKIAECKSYSQAAKELFISQSSLSMTTKKLEDELGIKLFNYQGRVLSLTAEGEQMYALAKNFWKSYEDFCGGAKRIGKEIRGNVSLILPALLGDMFFSACIGEFRRLHPNVTVSICNESGLATQHKVIANECDLAVTIHPLISDTFECVDIVTSPMVLAVHESHPLARRGIVSYDELRDETFLSFPEDSTLFRMLIDRTSGCGYDPKVVVQAQEAPFLLSLVSENNGIFVVPEIVLPFGTSRHIRVVRLMGEEAGYKMVMIYQREKYHSAACQALIDFITNWYAEGVTKHEENM